MNTSVTSSDAPSASFSGHSEGAPLDLTGLSDSVLRATTSRLAERTFEAWADTAAAVRHCSQPVRLTGSSETFQFDPATGEIGKLISRFNSSAEPLGVLHRPCGNRRAEICPACSRVYARDTFAMIRAGISGGKTVPDSVTNSPLLFVTLTAPSFGAVHGLKADGDRSCHPRRRLGSCVHGRRRWCSARHTEDDPHLGSPLCSDCHDTSSAVVWQWWAPELWRRTTIALRRTLSRELGVVASRLSTRGSLQFAKVAEFQARGLVHFHALVRLDGPDGAGSPSPVSGDQFAEMVREAASGVRFTVPAIDDRDVDRVLAWGRQVDIRVVRTGDRDATSNGELHADQVAGYLAKYSTKDAGSLRQSGHAQPHLVRFEELARALGRRAVAHDPVSPYALLAKWAHMLGFRGHFSTKSRRYSVTLGALRRARQRFQTLISQDRDAVTSLDIRQLEELLLADAEETTLVVGRWAYQGTGWLRPGDATLALAAAARAREHDQWLAEQRRRTTTERRVS